MGSLPGFGIGITIAILQSEGKSPDIEILLKVFKRSNRKELGRCLSNKRKWSTILHINWKVITTWARTNFPGEIKKK